MTILGRCFPMLLIPHKRYVLKPSPAWPYIDRFPRNWLERGEIFLDWKDRPQNSFFSMGSPDSLSTLRRIERYQDKRGNHCIGNGLR